MFSRLLRRVHLYLALFLTPWILMYAASTVVMNHRQHFLRWYGGPPPAMAFEREQSYDAVFPPDASPQQISAQILLSLDLEGAFNANRRARDGAIVINRLDPITPRRITYEPAAHRLVMERLPWDSRAYLERMHRRRGYQHDPLLEDTWAVSVDLFIAAVIFWVLSGMWMWWELKKTRRWGVIALAGGAMLFAFFLVML
ncbi:MAG TPA: hypothetical protein VIO38_01720 [Rariglobus sp.]